MELELNSNGLPKAGRLLDAWIAEHIPELGYKWRIDPAWGERLLLAPGLREHWELASGTEPLHPGWRLEVQSFSTTHAYHQALLAMESCERQFRWVTYGSNDVFNILLWDKDWQESRQFWEVEVEVADYSSRICAEAHVVCAAAWKAMGGEDG